MMDLNPGLMLWTIISFVILLFILNKVAWQPILKALDEREKGIKDDQEAARKASAEAQAMLEDYQQKLKEAHAEAQNVVAQAREAAERVGEELEQQARAKAKSIVEKAEQEIDLHRQAAINEIRGEIASLAIFSAEKIISKSLDSEDHRRLVMQSLEERKS